MDYAAELIDGVGPRPTVLPIGGVSNNFPPFAVHDTISTAQDTAVTIQILAMTRIRMETR